MLKDTPQNPAVAGGAGVRKKDCLNNIDIIYYRCFNEA
jgi:hypothetical protein